MYKKLAIKTLVENNRLNGEANHLFHINDCIVDALNQKRYSIPNSGIKELAINEPYYKLLISNSVQNSISIDVSVFWDDALIKRETFVYIENSETYKRVDFDDLKQPKIYAQKVAEFIDKHRTEFLADYKKQIEDVNNDFKFDKGSMDDNNADLRWDEP